MQDSQREEKGRKEQSQGNKTTERTSTVLHNTTIKEGNWLEVGGAFRRLDGAEIFEREQEKKCTMLTDKARGRTQSNFSVSL